MLWCLTDEWIKWFNVWILYTVFHFCNEPKKKKKRQVNSIWDKRYIYKCKSDKTKLKFLLKKYLFK